MNWLLDNLQLVVIVASAFAWWWSQRRGGAGQEPPESGEREDATTYGELERTRRIQEEIRRKIAERQGRSAMPDISETDTRPVAEPPPLVIEPVPPAMAWEPDEEALERQRQLESRMRELEAQRRAARAAAQATGFPPAPASDRASAGRNLGEREWLQALRDRRSVRQAVILREILDAPVGLKEPRR